MIEIGDSAFYDGVFVFLRKGQLIMDTGPSFFCGANSIVASLFTQAFLCGFFRRCDEASYAFLLFCYDGMMDIVHNGVLRSSLWMGALGVFLSAW
jgi:hypothetical protein